MKKGILFIPGLAVVCILAIGIWSSRGAIRDWIYDFNRPSVPPAVAYQPGKNPTPVQPGLDLTHVTSTKGGTSTTTLPVVTPTTSSTLPAEVNLSIPFVLQAPKQNWNMPFQEACEEASMLMVNAYYQSRTTKFTPDESEKAILDLVAYEEDNGYKMDITAAEVKAVMAAYFKLNKVVLLKNPTTDQLKTALSNGYPIIVPAAGKLLKNPNFRNGGPPYHMFVLKGYTKDGRWITNDPGTFRGPDYVYSNATLMNAIHDFREGDMINGEKVVLVVQPN